VRIESVIASLGLSVLSICPSMTAQAQSASDVVAFSSSQPGEVVVPVFIGQRGPYRFLLDTGSTHTAVTEALAADLGLVVVSQAPLTTATHTTMYKVVRIEGFEIGSARGGALLATLLPRAAGDVLWAERRCRLWDSQTESWGTARRCVGRRHEHSGTRRPGGCDTDEVRI